MSITNAKSIGIIGGGQLGYMLIKYGIRKIDQRVQIFVLSESENCSCSRIPNDENVTIIIGKLSDELQIKSFIDMCDIVTWETEHFNTSIDSPKWIPNIDTLRIINNKITQKQWLQDNGIETTPFIHGTHKQDLLFYFSERGAIMCTNTTTKAIMDCGEKLVIKLPCGGYDGKAVRIIPKDIISKKGDINDNIGTPSNPILVEKYIKHKEEISVIIATDSNGCVVNYDVIGMKFHKQHNILDQCYPANKLVPQIEQQAFVLAKRVVSALGSPGLFAVEMFYDTVDGLLYVNEIAPRVHNSGHHTINTHDISQFEMLARMLLRLNIYTPRLIFPHFLMCNILGPSYIDKQPYQIRNRLCVSSEESPFVIDYNKSMSAPQKKIGHVCYFSKEDNVHEQYNVYQQFIQVVPADTTPHQFKVGVVMGSISDYTVMKAACDTLGQFGVQYEVSIVSAHRTPDRLRLYAKTAYDRHVNVIIAGAGGAAHLPGMLASNTTVPVIGVPVKSSALSGVDSLYSIVQMPPGVPVACMSVDGAKNAALYALHIASITSGDIRNKLERFRSKSRNVVYESCSQLQ